MANRIGHRWTTVPFIRDSISGGEIPVAAIQISLNSRPYQSMPTVYCEKMESTRYFISLKEIQTRRVGA